MESPRRARGFSVDTSWAFRGGCVGSTRNRLWGIREASVRHPCGVHVQSAGVYGVSVLVTSMGSSWGCPWAVHGALERVFCGS